MNITIVPPNPIEITVVEPTATALTVNAGSPVEVTVIQSLTTTGSVTTVAPENAERILKRVHNNTGSTLEKGKAVYVTGGHGSSDLEVALADKSSGAHSDGTLGLVYENITNNSTGYIVTQGFLQGFTTNTLAGNEGDKVYLDTNGGLTTTRPTQPDHTIAIGYLVKKGGGGIGSVYVAVVRGEHLEYLHDVLLTTPLDGQLLTYDGTAGLWKNIAPAGTITNLAYLPNNQTFTGNNTFTGGLDVTNATITGLIINDVVNLSPTIATINTTLLNKTNFGHTHVVADVTGLQTDLNNKAALVHTHVIADVTGLQTALDGKALAGHTHPQSDITGLVTDLSNKSNVGHGHAQSEITNLVSDLAGKAPTVHTHAIANIVNLQSELDNKIDTTNNNTFTGSTTFTGGLSSNTTTLTSNTAISGSLNLSTANIIGLSSADIADWYTEGTDPNSPTIIRDDFIGSGSETGEIGSMMWQYSGMTVSGLDAPSGRPGVMKINRSSTTGIFFSGVSSVAGSVHTDNVEYFCYIFRDNETDTVSNRTIGLSDSAASPTKFIGLRKLTSTASAGDWYVDAYNTTPAPIPTTLAFTGDTNYHKVEFTKIATNTWSVTVDGTIITTILSSVAPVASLLPTITLNGTTTITQNLDFFSMRIGATSR